MLGGVRERMSPETGGGCGARVGEILSDSNSELSSLGDHSGRSDDDERESHGAPAPQRSGRPPAAAAAAAAGPAAKIHQRPPTTALIRRKNSKWYDSDDDDDAGGGGGTDDGSNQRVTHHGGDSSWRRRDEAMGPDPAAAVSVGATTSGPSAAFAPPPPPISDERPSSRESSRSILSPDSAAAGGAARTGAGATRALVSAADGAKRSSFQRLVDKTFNLSPFGTKRKSPLDVTSPASSGPDTPRSSNNHASARPTTTAGMSGLARMRSPLSDASSSDAHVAARNDRRISRKASQDRMLGTIENGADGRQAPPHRRESAADARRRTSHPAASSTIQSPNATTSEHGETSSGRRTSELPLGPGGTEAALSPGQRKFPGAFPGRPGSGVLLEGWLRQKQRRGVKGMKKWNSRYFVLYAKTNEVRYYADVVQSAWGPIPLREIGSIALRLIQRIGKPGNVKYKGCRLDITCRNTWGTHYADDYVSSEDENQSAGGNQSHNGDGDAPPRRAGGGDTKNTTPKSSRVYSLMADSPQTAGAWFTMLDSLLVRSANSPRVDVAPSQKLKKMASGTKMSTRRRSSALETETLVVVGPTENVPRAVLYAINYIFDSTPGIETPQFYEKSPETPRLKAALKYLNQFSAAVTSDPSAKPTRDELEVVLDPITAGGVVKTWLRQMEQPIVPFEMYPDFLLLAADAKTAPFDLHRNLKTLVKALPPRSFAILACLLFHLNDVNVYSSKNSMDAAVLSGLFADCILRPRAGESDQDKPIIRALVEEMIAHVDAIIDEKEAEILEQV